MEHLDEGTIHAWIDGGLGGAQSRDIEAHVAQCPTCSAAVAEARGLIAASSRILIALDDVPGGVVPRRAPVAPLLATTTKRRRIAAWVPALAAAALVVAVGLQVADREPAASSVAENQVLGLSARRESADSATAQTQPRAQVVTTAAPGAGSGGAPAAMAPVTPVAPPSARDLTRADVRESAESRVAGAAVGGVAGPTVQRATAPAAAPAPAPPTEALAEAAKMERAPMMKSATQALADAPLLQTMAGCYRVESEANQSLSGRAANVAAGATRAAADPRVKRAAPAAAQTSAADFAVSAAPGVVRLDTVARPLGLPVLSARSDSVVGWWTRAGADSANVRLLAGVALTLTVKNRVPCPER
jgi:hypothetical protein